MKTAELRDKSASELLELYEEMRQELFTLTVRKEVADEADNPLKVRNLRREIARIKTVMNEKQEGDEGHE